MEKEKAQDRIQQLSQQLEAHNYKYYVLSSPTISDFEFDSLLKELFELEKQYPELAHENSPTKRVGGQVSQSFPTVQHKYPMLSLDNTYTREELKGFVQRINKWLQVEGELSLKIMVDGVLLSSIMMRIVIWDERIYLLQQTVLFLGDGI